MLFRYRLRRRDGVMVVAGECQRRLTFNFPSKIRFLFAIIGCHRNVFFSQLLQRLGTVIFYPAEQIAEHRSFIKQPTTWNSLSADLRDPTCSDESFRRSLKTFLFAKY